DDLVPMEIEVDPLFRAAAFRAAEELAIELARSGQVVHREREMERRHRCRIRRGRLHVAGLEGSCEEPDPRIRHRKQKAIFFDSTHKFRLWIACLATAAGVLQVVAFVTFSRELLTSALA